MFHWRKLVYYGMLFLLTALLMCELKLLWRSVYIKIYSLCRYALTNIFLCFYVVLTSILSCLIRTLRVQSVVVCSFLFFSFSLLNGRALLMCELKLFVTICLYKNIFSMQTQSSALLLLFTDTQHNADHRNIRLHTHDSFCLYFSVSCVLTDTDLVLLQICIVNCVKMFVCVKHLFWGAIKPTAKLYFWQLGLTEFYRGFL